MNRSIVQALATSLVLALASTGCGGSGHAVSGTDGGHTSGEAGPPKNLSRWPTANQWSWNGSWSPSPSDFPIAGMFDDKYFDGHNGTPILPPGAWDYDPSTSDLANWRNFNTNLGHFDPLKDRAGHQYGWKFVGNHTNTDYQGPAAYFEGSPGVDYVYVGPQGSIHSLGLGEGELGDGPDVLIFDKSYSLDYRTGSSETAHAHDDDLVIGGCTPNNDSSFDIDTTTIHTGPGNDWVFVRDLQHAAIDLGNGANGRTDTLDPDDGDDLVVLRGNTYDFRVFGGSGSDTAVWYIDDNKQTVNYLGPDFFGGGGKGKALWNDPGTDRLVLAIPTTTRIVGTTPTPPGALLVRAGDGSFVADAPTAGDPYAAYCVQCGTGPGGRKTMTMEYNSANGTVHTGYFGVTSFEELQIGVGNGARVYRLDDVHGKAILDSSLTPYDPPAFPPTYCR